MITNLFLFSSEALTILSLHQAKIVKPTATKYIMQLADLKLHICTYIQVWKTNNRVNIFDFTFVLFLFRLKIINQEYFV